MTFKFFDQMENILGDQKTIQGQSTISSTFANCKKNPKLKSTMLPQRDTFIARSDSSIDDKIGDEIGDESPSTSNSVNTNSAKRKIYENLSKIYENHADWIKINKLSKRWNCQI